jgi:SSS family solute:Na+ symporter
MYTAELGFKNGFAGAAPGVLEFLAFLLVGLTGFAIGPLRKANVMTIPELFQKRFGTRVRWLAGLVVALGGILNMGIFLRLGGEFFVHIGGLNPKYLELTMTVLLATVLLYTAMGGMVSVLVAHYLQFLMTGLGLIVTSVLVVWNTGWSHLVSQLSVAHQAGSAAVAGGARGGLAMADPSIPLPATAGCG